MAVESAVEAERVQRTLRDGGGLRGARARRQLRESGVVFLSASVPRAEQQ